MLKDVHLTGGTTHTVESFWNARGTAFFKGPEGAKINVKYGKGRLSRNTQAQTLDGHTYKRLRVGAGSLLLARMRVKVTQSTDITYDVYPGGVAVNAPEIPF